MEEVIAFLTTVGVVMLAFILLAGVLTFAQYKKRPSGCCGEGHCQTSAGPPPNHECCGASGHSE